MKKMLTGLIILFVLILANNTLALADNADEDNLNGDLLIEINSDFINSYHLYDFSFIFRDIFSNDSFIIGPLNTQTVTVSLLLDQEYEICLFTRNDDILLNQFHIINETGDIVDKILITESSVVYLIIAEIPDTNSFINPDVIENTLDTPENTALQNTTIAGIWAKALKSTVSSWILVLLAVIISIAIYLLSKKRKAIEAFNAIVGEDTHK